MKKLFLLSLLIFTLTINSFAEKDKKPKGGAPVDSIQLALENYVKFADSVNNAMKFEKGLIAVKGGFAKLNVPAGFKFLHAEQSQYVLHDLWGNPERPDVLGMIFPENTTPFTDSSFVFILSFDDMGYVKDNDAEDIDYDEMLKQMQEGEAEDNKLRVAQGYPSIHMAGWAQKPFYDAKKKVLHWAKDLEFGDNDGAHTLNYDVRVLGRKGVLSMNAVASMSELDKVKQNIDAILNMASFTEGNAYTDFDSGTDKVAAYTIGGLVAGKVLAKVGLWAAILKFWKLIVGGVIAAFYGIRKWLTGRGRQEEEIEAEISSDNEEQTS